MLELKIRFIFYLYGIFFVSSDIGILFVCFLDGMGWLEIVLDFMGSGGGLFVGFL